MESELEELLCMMDGAPKVNLRNVDSDIIRILKERGAIKMTSIPYEFEITELGNTIAFAAHNEWRYRQGFDYLAITKEGKITLIRRT